MVWRTFNHDRVVLLIQIDDIIDLNVYKNILEDCMPPNSCKNMIVN